MARLDAEGWWPWLQGEGCPAALGNELENAETAPDADSESKERPCSAQAATYTLQSGPKRPRQSLLGLSLFIGVLSPQLHPAF